jgi:hypothetical protein
MVRAELDRNPDALAVEQNSLLVYTGVLEPRCNIE